MLHKVATVSDERYYTTECMLSGSCTQQAHLHPECPFRLLPEQEICFSLVEFNGGFSRNEIRKQPKTRITAKMSDEMIELYVMLVGKCDET